MKAIFSEVAVIISATAVSHDYDAFDNLVARSSDNFGMNLHQGDIVLVEAENAETIVRCQYATNKYGLLYRSEFERLGEL